MRNNIQEYLLLPADGDDNNNNNKTNINNKLLQNEVFLIAEYRLQTMPILEIFATLK